MSDIFRLDGDVAVVIGGAGSIGKSIAFGLAQQGAKVVVASRNLPNLQEVVRRIQSEVKSDAIALQVDVTDEQSVAKLVQQVVSKLGTVNILVNSQGLNIKRPATEFPIQDWDLLFDVNVRGTMIACREFAKIMIEKRKGKIINISSVRGIRATKWGGDNAGYCTVKSAIDMLTRTLAAEWAPYGINVNAVAPSAVMSELVARTMKEDPERLAKNIANIPMGRIAEPEDVVNACIFLASRASDFITGQILYVDGGLTAIG